MLEPYLSNGTAVAAIVEEVNRTSCFQTASVNFWTHEVLPAFRNFLETLKAAGTIVRCLSVSASHAPVNNGHVWQLFFGLCSSPDTTYTDRGQTIQHEYLHLVCTVYSDLLGHLLRTNCLHNSECLYNVGYEVK